MKEVIAGIAVVLILVGVLYLVYNTMMRKHRRKNLLMRPRLMPNFDLGYYIGFPNKPSPRFVSPLRPYIYRPEPPVPFLVPRRRNYVRRVYV